MPCSGKLFDDRGNRMSPTWARKGSKRWRYYVSQAALQGDKSKAGSIVRVPATDVETLVAEALGNRSPDRAASQTDIRNLIDRVVIGRATIRIQLSEVAEEIDSARILTLPWTPPSPYCKREIIQGANDANTYARPMRANARAILIEALGDAHRWLNELLSDPRQTLESIASREGKTERSIRMTLSLAFLAPEIVKAAVQGRLPRGFGLKRLVDLPMAWPDQWRTLDSRRRRRRKERSALARLSSRQGLIHPSEPGQVSRFEPKGRSKSGAVDTWRTATLETEICGRRLSARRRQELPLRIAEPPVETGPWEATYGNVVLSCGAGNHVDLRG